MISVWQSYLSVRRNVYNLGFTFALLIPVLIVLPIYLTFNENREGFAFVDPILSLFQAIDVTWWTFIVIYFGLITALIHLRHYPDYFLLALKVYALTGIFRITGMYFLPLEPPLTIIPLDDPFVQLFGTGKILTKDLFFSGHTSTMFIFFLTAQTKWMKSIFLIATFLVALCVIIQHVHYTIDVFAAPFFAYTAFEIAKRIDKKFAT